MHEGETQNGQGGVLDLSPKQSLGVYANLVIINHSGSEFVFDFARIMPGMDSPRVVSRVIMTPDHAKRFLLAMQGNVGAYEQSYGQIKLPEQGEQISIPFSEGMAPEA
ncbi:MAG: hypothetical protein CSA97_03930 [Bacteroidetes bacterium]|nr:MAG: hypothetical protein CSA97_03930 [Bacteroidota bacterium]